MVGNFIERRGVRPCLEVWTVKLTNWGRSSCFGEYSRATRGKWGLRSQQKLYLRLELDLLALLELINDLAYLIDIKLFGFEAVQLWVQLMQLSLLLLSQRSVEHVGLEQSVDFCFDPFHVFVLAHFVLLLHGSNGLPHCMAQKLDDCVEKADVVLFVKTYLGAELHAVVTVLCRVIAWLDLLPDRTVHEKELAVVVRNSSQLAVQLILLYQ